eukprot:symbB.v1.2.023506.t1/scaffold2074.1/size157288/6
MVFSPASNASTEIGSERVVSSHSDDNGGGGDDSISDFSDSDVIWGESLSPWKYSFGPKDYCDYDDEYGRESECSPDSPGPNPSHQDPDRDALLDMYEKGYAAGYAIGVELFQSYKPVELPKPATPPLKPKMKQPLTPEKPPLKPLVPVPVTPERPEKRKTPETPMAPVPVTPEKPPVKRCPPCPPSRSRSPRRRWSTFFERYVEVEVDVSSAGPSAPTKPRQWRRYMLDEFHDGPN